MPKYRTAAVQEDAKNAVNEAQQAIASPPGDEAERLRLAKRLAALNEIGYAQKVLLKADLSNLPNEKAETLATACVNPRG